MEMAMSFRYLVQRRDGIVNSLGKKTSITCMGIQKYSS